LTEPRHNRNSAASREIRYANGFYKQKGDAFEVNIVVPPEKRTQFASALEALLATVAEDAEAPRGAAEQGALSGE
jgi:ParB family chromosome partitioning protein